jgi:D-amino-acid dehydrogenase
LRLPNDETGDCFKFTNALAAMAQAKGVTFRYGTEVESLAADAGRIVSVQTSKGTIVADRYVVAMGTRSPQAVRPLGLRLPVYPVKGYSITAPIVDVERSPASTVVDESYKVAFTRLGDRIRVGGTAEIAGHDLRLRPERRATLVHLLQDLFPGAGDVEAASFWTGLRPMTPDGTPVIGRTSIPNLFLNTGHGTLGWTMACGSGALLADLIGGTEPAIDASDLSIARYDQN